MHSDASWQGGKSAGRLASMQAGTGRQSGRQTFRHASRHVDSSKNCNHNAHFARVNKNSIKMKIPGKSSKKHDQHANPRKVF